MNTQTISILYFVRRFLTTGRLITKLFLYRKCHKVLSFSKIFSLTFKILNERSFCVIKFLTVFSQQFLCLVFAKLETFCSRPIHQNLFPSINKQHESYPAKIATRFKNHLVTQINRHILSKLT